MAEIDIDPWMRRSRTKAEARAYAEDIRRMEAAAAGFFVTIGYSSWKRRAIAPFFDGDTTRLNHVGSAREAERLLADGATWLAWGGDAEPPFPDTKTLFLEDGFLRSVGLGIHGVAPASLVLDPLGLYFDARKPSHFERIASTATFTPQLLARAGALREMLLEARLTKYNVGGRIALPEGRGKHKIIVPGQVEGDASIRFGSPEVKKNAELLERARAGNPEAFILYKPHPDVVSGLRAGAVPADILAKCADAVVTDASMADCLDWADTVETMTSLAGFEALLRGKNVIVHGQPFYACWGLTRDHYPMARRTRRLTVDELVAAALILYPHYVDPVTKKRCPPEILIERLSILRDRPLPLSTKLRQALAKAHATFMHRFLAPLFERDPRR